LRHVSAKDDVSHKHTHIQLLEIIYYRILLG